MSHPPKYIVKKADGTPLPEDEPYFVLRAQDQFGVFALRMYTDVIRMSGYFNKRDVTELLEHLQEHIVEFEAWPVKKWPD